MADPVQKTQTNASTFQRMLETREQFYSFVGKTYNETIMYIGKNAKKTFWIGVTGMGLAFYGGFTAGRSVSSDKIVEHTYSTVKSTDQKLINLISEVEGLKAKQETFGRSIQEIKVSQFELKNEFNSVRIQKMAEQGQAHAEQVQNAKKHWWQFWKKALP